MKINFDIMIGFSLLLICAMFLITSYGKYTMELFMIIIYSFGWGMTQIEVGMLRNRLDASLGRGEQ